MFDKFRGKLIKICNCNFTEKREMLLWTLMIMKFELKDIFDTDYICKYLLPQGTNYEQKYHRNSKKIVGSCKGLYKW